MSPDERSAEERQRATAAAQQIGDEARLAAEEQGREAAADATRISALVSTSVRTIDAPGTAVPLGSTTSPLNCAAATCKSMSMILKNIGRSYIVWIFALQRIDTV